MTASILAAIRFLAAIRLFGQGDFSLPGYITEVPMITSSQNSRIKNVTAIRKKPKERNAQDLFLVEGVKMFLEAPLERITEVYLSSSYYNSISDCGSDAIRKLKKLTNVEIVADPVFESMADTKTPQGVICLVRQFHYQISDLLAGTCSGNAFCMVLENLQDPGNLGTIVRTAEGAGVTGILLSKDCVDIYNPKVIRSTMGSVFRVPFFYTDDLEKTLEQWKSKGIRLYAAHLKGSTPYTQENYQGPSAFLIGNESKGLTDRTASIADQNIRIPMKGKVESLNASAAASILMYEAARQRS